MNSIYPIPFADVQEYRLEVCKDGTLDKRSKRNKNYIELKTRQKEQEYQETIAALKNEVAELKKTNATFQTMHKRDIKKINDLSGEEVAEEECCVICMEPKSGIASLPCGHEFCTDCFAQHSRETNQCPLCRDEFTCKPKKSEHLSEALINGMVDEWADNIDPYYFMRMVDRYGQKRTFSERALFLRWIVTRNAAMIIANKVRPFYEE